MRYRFIIFDFDGTLGDTFPWFARVLNKVADKYRFKQIKPEEVEALRGLEGRQILSYMGVPVWKTPLIAAHMRSLMTEDIKEVALFPGIDLMLRALVEQDAELAVVSSNSPENIGLVLGQDIATLFSHYVCGVSMFGKQRKLKKIVAQSGYPLEDIIYVGDEIRDVQAARKVGIDFGAVSWGYNRIEAIKAHQPNLIFETVDDMVSKLIA